VLTPASDAAGVALFPSVARSYRKGLSSEGPQRRAPFAPLFVHRAAAAGKMEMLKFAIFSDPEMPAALFWWGVAISLAAVWLLILYGIIFLVFRYAFGVDLWNPFT